MKKASRYLRSLFVVGLLFSSICSYATHIVGVDLFYTYVTGNTYKITLVAYGDCAGAAFSSLATSTPQICVYDGGTSVGSITLTLQPPTTGVEITPVCPADSLLTQCTNISYTIPGIKKFVYTGTYTLPYTSAVWRFLFTGNMGGASSAGRGSTITNIVGPGTTIIQLVDTLNNMVYHNTNPSLTVLPTPFFCLNNPDNYNPGASDPDGDSLTFYLVAADNGTTVCTSIGGSVTYVPPYTPTAPLATSSYSFDPLTGQISFTPNLLQRALVVYNIEERRAGTMVGTCQREMTFLVLTCTDVAPTGGYTSTTAGTITDSTDFSICQNVGPFTITMAPKEVDTFNNITVTATGVPAGITFTTVNNGTHHPVCTISGNSTTLAPGTYIYYVTFKDNSCPLNGVRTEAFTITVLVPPVVLTGPPATICQGVTATLSASGAATYLWSPGTGLSCTTCSGPIASPPSTTLYTVTGTAINGCSSTDTERVTILPLPVLVTGTTASICIGSNAPLSVSGAASYIWTPAATLSCSTCTNPVATPVTSTTYSVTGTGANGCQNTATVTITVNPLPAISVSPAGMCAGGTATLFPSGGVSYVWSPALGLSCTACTNPVSSVTVTTTYTVTGTDINGCADTASITVTVSAKPAPPAVVSPITYCQNATPVALTATGASLLWYTTLTGGIGSASAPIPSTSTPGSTTWYVSQTVGGCESDRDSITVIILPLPVIAISPSSAAICFGQDTTLTATGGVSYTWMPPAGLSATTGSVVIASPAATTTYTVTGTGSNGCSDTASILVTVHPLPVIAIFATADTICSGSSTTLLTGGAVTYTWSPASSLSSSTGSTVIAAPTVTTTYTITGKDAFSCKDTATIRITVNPVPPAPPVVSPVIYCLHATAIPLIATGAGLLWYTIPVGGTGSAGTPTPSTTVAGATTWYVSQTVSGCESPRDSIKIIVHPLPVVSISPSAPAICAGQDTTLAASGALTYSWLPPTGLIVATGAVVIASPAITTTYTVTGTDVNGCIATDSQVVTVHPLPVISIAPVGICIGADATLTVSGASTYTWSPAATLSSSAGAGVVATPSVTTTYNVTGTDAYGCINATLVTVTVSAIPPAPPVISPVTYCRDAVDTELHATGSHLLWYTTPTGGAGSATDPVPSTVAVDSTWWYVSQSVSGCEGPRDSIKVIIMPDAKTDFTYIVMPGCIEDTVQFVNTSPNAHWYLWNFGDGSKTDTEANPVHLYPPATAPEDYTVKLYGAIPVCFEDSTIKPVTLVPASLPLLINITQDQTIPYGTSIQLNADGADSFLWAPDNGSLNNIHIHNPEAKPTENTTYIVYGTDLNGCMDSAEVKITLSYVDSPIIPSAFTPNGDGKDDILTILNLRYNKLVEFRIYNRWGQVVFQTSDPTQGWDGTFLGTPQPLDVFQYMFTTTHPDGSDEKMYKGNVTLIR